MSTELDDVVRSIWRSRVVLLSAFGLVGVGAVIGAGSVYMFYIRNKLQNIFRIQTALSTQLQNLKKEVEKINIQVENPEEVINVEPEPAISGECVAVSKRSSILSKLSVRKRTRVKSRDENDTTDEYNTASSESGNDYESAPCNTDNLDIPSGAEGWIIDFLKEVDKLLDGDASSQHEAYVRLQSYKDKLEHLCGFWWRFAKATHMESAAAAEVGDKEMRRSLVLSGLSRAEKALNLNGNSANAHKWYAITLGCKGDYVAINEKIKNGFTFKEHVDRAVQLNSKDPSLHYLLGRFCLEVSQLGWMERKIASTLFSSPPTATPQEALQHFQASERLGKPLKDNRLYMAKCFIVLKNNEKAAYWLKMTVEMPSVSSSDKSIHEEAQKLYTKYRQYLK